MGCNGSKEPPGGYKLQQGNIALIPGGSASTPMTGVWHDKLGQTNKGLQTNQMDTIEKSAQSLSTGDAVSASPDAIHLKVIQDFQLSSDRSLVEIAVAEDENANVPQSRKESIFTDQTDLGSPSQRSNFAFPSVPSQFYRAIQKTK